MLLKGKTAIVSGVEPGLGHEIARAFVREGAAVVIGGRREPYLREVAGELEVLGGTVHPVPIDVSDPVQCRRIVEVALGELGRVDVLVNNAFAPDVFEPFESVDLDAWRRIMDVNLFGSLQLTGEVVEPMKAGGGGSIVFVNSIVVRNVASSQGGDATSKGALLTAAQVLAKELGPHGIRVNTVVTAESRRAPEHDDALVARIPLGFVPSDDDCANAVVFFASDLSAVVTGQSLDVNGGEVFH